MSFKRNWTHFSWSWSFENDPQLHPPRLGLTLAGLYLEGLRVSICTPREKSLPSGYARLALYPGYRLEGNDLIPQVVRQVFENELSGFALPHEPIGWNGGTLEITVRGNRTLPATEEALEWTLALLEHFGIDPQTVPSPHVHHVTEVNRNRQWENIGGFFWDNARRRRESRLARSVP